MSTVPMAKKILRKEMRELIAQTLRGANNDGKLRESESTVVREKLLANECFVCAKRISIYVSNEQEICTDEIVRTALRGGKEVFIPRFQKGASRMEMLRLSTEAEFESLEGTLWGIRQHPAHLNPPSFDETSAKNPLDLVVMPGLAFTECGKRLGHGRGFYDRFLNEYSQKYGVQPKTIGLALRAQIVDELPMEVHDRRVDVVLHA